MEKFRASPLFEESKTQYPPGWAANDLFADPKFARFSGNWKDALDLSLQQGSPAINAGVAVPSEWLDPLRGTDKGKPDVGALPFGGEPWRVGMRGRLTLFGEKKESLAISACEPKKGGGSHAVSGENKVIRKPAVMIQGYPAFDAPYAEFALKRRGVRVDILDKTWLEPGEYGKYGVVVIVGNLARAQVEPSKYREEDMGRLMKFLKDGGALMLMHSTQDLFASAEGFAFLSELAGLDSDAALAGKSRAVEGPVSIRKPDHPWVKHLDAKKPHSWLTPAGDVLIPAGIMSKGECILGDSSGRAILCKIPVGKGTLIYLGWRISRSMPSGREPSTVEQESAFEDQIRIVMNIMSEFYP
ncbi:MAG: hypothetical protein HY360_06960 [Verrucomicrobia bacterium]|nr:hypothetical protein [Verrucomicrobiota bacterium]